jgi:hypothetical protein
VELVVSDEGLATTTARVRCERTVPIRGSASLWKKSSIIVTKRIEVDLTVTPARRRLLSIIKGVHSTVSDDTEDEIAKEIRGCPLSKADTIELYKSFMSLAEMTKALNQNSS